MLAANAETESPLKGVLEHAPNGLQRQGTCDHARPSASVGTILQCSANDADYTAIDAGRASYAALGQSRAIEGLAQKTKVPGFKRIPVLGDVAIAFLGRLLENDLRNLGDQRKSDGLVKQLAEECGSELLRFISRRLRSIVDPQDLAQETYVRLLRLERKDLIRDPRPYLFRIASNILYEFELSRKNDIAGHTRWSAEQDLDSDFGLVEQSVESLGLRKHLESALRGLSPKCRAVVILHRRDGMTYEEIADEIGVSRSMVKKYLAQGLLHCRGRLRNYR